MRVLNPVGPSGHFLAPASSKLRPEVQILRSRRHSSGFWTRPPFEVQSSRRLPEGINQIFWVDLGIRAVYQVSDNHLHSDFKDIGYREFSALIKDIKTNEVMGVIEMQFLQAPGTSYSNRYYAKALEQWSEESEAFGQNLSTTCQSLADVFAAGRTIAQLDRIELRPETRLKGHGMDVATRVLQLTRYRFGAMAFLIFPFPLQYTKGRPELTCREREEAWSQFEADKGKLIQLYKDNWSAQHLDNGYMVASPFLEITVSARTKKWRLR